LARVKDVGEVCILKDIIQKRY